MKDLEKTLDLDSFGYVSFKLPQHIGAGTSAATTSQQPAQEDTPPIGTSKGKEMMHSEQQEITDQPTSSQQQSQGKIPPPQTHALEILALQSPLNEEKGRKKGPGRGYTNKWASKAARSKEAESGSST